MTTATAPPARAVENGVTDLLGVLGSGGDPTRNLATWTAGLGAVGKLGEQLPLVSASPGGLLGFTDLFKKAVTDELASAVDFDDLVVDKPIDIGGGRTGHLTTTVSDEGAGKKLNVLVTVNKTATGQDLHLLNAEPKVDLSITDGINVALKSRLALSLVWTGTDDDKVYVVSSPSTPRLDVDAHATVSNASAKAAIGILGVTLEGSTLNLRAHFVGKVSDPDNDGKLFFTEGATAGDGELGQDGSLEGLVTVGLDPEGSAPIDNSDPDSRGSIKDTSFVLGAAPAAAGLDLPGNINATIGVSWPDIGVSSPTVTAPDLDSTVGKFQNMGVQDLADGLGQVIVAITALQKAKFDLDGDGPLPEIGDLNLPFMRGSLSDAIQVNETLKTFLAKNTVPGPGQEGFDPNGDPAQIGRATFASLQELLAEFKGFTGIALGTLGWDTGTSKLTLPLTMTKTAPATAVNLDEVSAAASGTGATYGDKTLKVSGAEWLENQWIGRRVTAGTSAGEVTGNTADEITLAADWIGGKPDNTTPFVISGADPHAGAVTFGNDVSEGGKGILNANADQTFAKVKPSYESKITLVLDLQDPKTEGDCEGFEGNTEPCPFKKDAGQLSTQVQSLPLNSDRMMIRTGSTLFDADFPIDSAVDLTANAGFFKVQLKGTMKVCNSSLADDCTGSPAGHMLSVGLKQVGDAPHDIRMSKLFKQLVDDPKALLDVDVNVRAFGDVTVSLPDAASFLPAGATTKFTAKWADLTNPSSIDIDTSDLSEIFKLDFDATDPRALFTALIKTLQTLSQQLADADTGAKGSGIFGKEIPGLGKSLRDLLLSDESNVGTDVEYGAASVVDKTRSSTKSPFTSKLIGRTVVVGSQIGVVKAVPNSQTLTLTKDWEAKPANGTAYAMRSALDDATDQLLALPPDNMQDAVNLLNDTLGTNAVKFRYLEVSGAPNLVLDVDWTRAYRVASPIRLDLPSLGKTFASGDASGQAQVVVNGGIKVGLAIPLAAGPGPSDGTTLKVLEDSSISIGAKAELTNGVVKGVIGPLSIALGKPGGTTAEKAQAKADLSLGLEKSGAVANKPVSFSSFIDDVSLKFNATSGTVDCAEGLNTDLMVCAKLPLYLNETGSSSGWTSIGDIALRLPKSTTPGDLFDFSGDLPDDAGEKKLVIPSDLGQRIQDAILDFGNLGDGFESYLAAIEKAFALASFQGKLPLIGEDLQKGADFIGKMRTALRTDVWDKLPGDGRPDDATEVADFLNTEIKKALEKNGLSSANVKIEFDCTATLKRVTPAPKVTATIAPPPDTDPPTPPDPTTTWEYKIVAYQGSGNDKTGDTIPSPAGSATNEFTLNAQNYNTLTWTKVDHASGYKVLRKGPGDTEFKLRAKLGDVATYKDEGMTTSAYGAEVTQEPKLDPCPLDFIDGVFVEFNANRGSVTPAKGCEDAGANKCIGDTVGLDIGIPGLALRQGANGTEGIGYKLGFELHVRLGLNKQDGFFINTHDGWDAGKPSPELQVGLNFDLPSSMRAELAFIEIDVKKTTASAGTPLFAGQFAIDLKSTAGEQPCITGSEGAACDPKPNAKLTMANLTNRPVGDLLGVSLKGAFDLDWIIEARADSAFPGVRANFKLKWAFDNKAPQQSGAPTVIEFAGVGISAGKFFENLLGKVVKEMKRVTGPIQPILDTLYAPIPVLSDLSRMAGGGDVTLMSLAHTFNTLSDGPDLTFVNTIKSIIEFINRLPSCDEDAKDCFVPLGGFKVSGDKALATSNSPTTADKMYSSVDALDGGTVKAAINGKNDNPDAGTNKVFGSSADDKGDTENSGFSFPILDNPASAFNLLMGGDVDLVKFDSGPLLIGFTWRQEFGPVYAPPPVMVTLSGSASVKLHVIAGLDTYGIRKAVEAVQAGEKTGVVKALDGLFFSTVDKSGQPLPVVQLTGEIAAGAAVSAVIIKVGIEGGLRLTIGFYWNDPNDDGKFRISEFKKAALVNPLCLFTMSGRLSLFLRVYITVGISPFSATFSFTLADVTLLDFSVSPDCDPPPPKLGGTVGDTLVVYAGKFGGKDFRGHETWDNKGTDYEEEVVKVIQLHYAQTKDDPKGDNPDFDGFAVEMLGERREYLDEDLQRVVVDGSTYDRKMIVTFIGDGKKDTDRDKAGNDPTEFDKDAVVIGSSAGDVITTGRGLSYVDGRRGDDIIVTGDVGGSKSNAWVAGGPGDDVITVGNGDNFVAGDGSLGDASKERTVTHHPDDQGEEGDEKTKVLAGVFDWESIDNPTTKDEVDSGLDQDGDDTIGVGLGSNKVRGQGGKDKIGVAADLPDGSLKAKSNVLIGDSGSDHIIGGSAADEIFTAAEVKHGVDADGPPDPGATNVVDTGLGSDQVWGSTGIDLVTSHSQDDQKAILRGGAGDDVLLGGYGTDEVYGGPGHDWVFAEPAEVSGPGADEMIDGKNYGPKRTYTKLPLPTGVSPNSKTLVGGLGNDHIIGGDGPATIFGDKHIDAEKCEAGNPVTSDPVDETTEGPPDGQDGNDLILGGAGVDTVSAGGADDIVYGFGNADLLCGQEGNDTLYGGSGADHVWGGTGADLIYGEAGADFLFGNGGNDTIYGGTQDDVIEGNNGSDWISGGAGNDVVYGGTRAAGRADTGGDDLYGDLGEDILIGDNGTVNNPYPFDLDGSTPTAGAGDRIHGGAGDDRAYGGLGDDIVNGNDGDDYLEGNNGSDTIHGNAGEDRIIGGSSQEVSAGVGRPDTGDFLFGDAGPDLILGDNAMVTVVSDPDQATRVTRMRGFAKLYQVELLDLGLTPTAGTSGNDLISGGDGQDVLYGQGGADRIKGDDGDDYAEGGPGIDWIEGNLGNDDLVGGSSTPLSGSGEATSGQPDTDDAVFGGPGDDVIIGDNGQVLRPFVGQDPSTSTVRLSAQPGVQMAGRVVELYDRKVGVDFLTEPPSNRFGADRISGGEGVDVLYGQDGDDFISGGAHDDYLEGNGGDDVLRGDLSLGGASTQTTVVPLTDPGWPGSASGLVLLIGASEPDGQDDMIGGSSAQAFRDGDDTMEGDGGDDVMLGDNGSLVRTIEEVGGVKKEKVYTDRYPNDAVPADATRSRTHDPALPGPSTRFCTTAQTTCEPAGAFGDDTMFGDDGNDGMWGQDGNDLMYGGNGDDDMFGELGDDTMFGGAGEDMMLGDRGGVVNQFLDEGDEPATFTQSMKQVPQESFTAFPRGKYDRRVDLLHDVDGDQWIGSPTDPAMPHNGITTGGKDRIRGGPDADQIHAGFGDDLVNGDSGGDRIFGDDGNDVLWGGKGCDPVLNAATPDCLTDGVFDSHARGENDRFVDHTFGGVGEDIIDYNPRGSYPGDCAPGSTPVTTGSGKNAVTVDPCVWFEMTDKNDDDPNDEETKANNQHHHGTDWQYGGWDRDVMQGNVSDNGPNVGDRMIDWTGAYNLYTHCNAAYGGHNDIRLLAPDLHEFLTNLAWSDGAGRTASDVTTPGTSAYRELAFTYQADFKEHGNGPAYPNTPGHFDQPNACEE